MTSLADIRERAANLTRVHREWRPGQTAYNALQQIAPDVADRIRGTDLDPFYDDGRLPAFWQHVRRELGVRT